MNSIGKRVLRAPLARLAGVVLGASLALGATGCVFESSTDAGPPPPPPPPPTTFTGSVTLQWTVDEVTDPNFCVMGNAATFDVVLTTAGGGFAGEFQAPCGAFTTTISSLAAGGYTGDAVLLDPAGRVRTTSIAVNPFNIIENSNLVINLDFPADSFL